MAILLTGGAGYIGSHTCLELLNAGYEVVIVDNLANSSRTAIARVEALTGKKVTLYQGDICDRSALMTIFSAHQIAAVIHFAGLKAVGESVAKPLAYYHNNVTGTVVLCEVMAAHGVFDLVFSSSATVYGNPETMPLTEDSPRSAVNPYGRTKLIIEEILADLQQSDPRWRVALLRYFNPIGAHASGQIGEDPRGIPNNLVPYLARVAVGRLPKLQIFGGDYPTVDGTGVRDYIHVVDLALGHLKALEYLQSHAGLHAFNLGTGRGYSVLEVVAAFAKAVGRALPYEIVARRPGDAAICYADPSHARAELGWQATRDIDEMCADVWRWQSQNPHGYADEA